MATDAELTETRFERLCGRVLDAARRAADEGQWDEVDSWVDELLAVDPGNVEADRLKARAASMRQAGRGGERALVTLVFCDVVGSTPLTERFEPEVIRDLWNPYRMRAATAIERFEGKVAGFVGDGIIAVFGHPIAHEDDARRAVLAGLDMINEVEPVSAKARDDHGIDLAIRVAVHTGITVVADLGSGTAQERRALVGPVPSLADRLQKHARPNGVVVSDVTHHLVRDDFRFTSEGVQQLIGIGREVEVFHVEGVRHTTDRLESPRFRQTALFGRDDELRLLAAAWDAIQATFDEPEATGQTFVVSGEGGIGKSRLIAELAAMGQRGRARVLSCGGDPYHSNVPFWPVAQLLEVELGIAGADPAERGLRLARALANRGFDDAAITPLLAPLVGAELPAGYAPLELDPSAARAMAMASLVEWLRDIASSTPCLLIVEDLHWADPSTRELLQMVAAHEIHGLLTVVSHRNDLDFPAGERIALGQLDEAASAELVTNLTQETPLDENLARAVLVRADGVPLYLEELVFAARTTGRADDVPHRIQEFLTARLRRPEVDLETAQIAATVGVTFDPSIVVDVVGEPDARERLATLSAAGITEAAGALLRFRHELLRDAAYQTQVLETRRARHLAIAAALQQREDTAPELLARHLDAGGDVGAAVQQYLVAGQRQQQAAAHTEAITTFGRVVEIAQELPPGAESQVLEMGARMGRVFSAVSRDGFGSPLAGPDLERVHGLCEMLDDRQETLNTLVGIWSHSFTVGDLDSAATTYALMCSMVDHPRLARNAAAVAACGGYQAMYEGDVAAARERLEAAAADLGLDDTGESTGWPLPNSPRAVAEIGAACIAILEEREADAAQWEQRALDTCSRLTFPRSVFTEGFVRVYMAWCRWLQGDRMSAAAEGARAVELAQKHGFTYFMVLGSSWSVLALPDHAERVVALDQVIGTMDLIGHRAFRPLLLLEKAEALLAVDGHAAVAALDQAMEEILKSGERLHEAPVLMRRGEIRLSLGDADGGTADLSRALTVASDQHAARFQTMAEAAIAATGHVLSGGDRRG